MEEIYDLKRENKTLKIQGVEREKLIKRLVGPLNNGGEYQNWQIVKSESRLTYTAQKTKFSIKNFFSKYG